MRLVLVFSLGLSGCALNMPTNDRIIELSHSETECSKEEIVVKHRRNSLTHREWDLTCGETKYFCEMQINDSVTCKAQM